MGLTPSAATLNKALIPMLRQIVGKPRVASALFGRDRWGNPFGDDRYENPYPMLEKMRADGPLVYRAAYQMWFVTGHDEVLAVLNHLAQATKPG